MIIKMTMEMKNISHTYDFNRSHTYDFNRSHRYEFNRPRTRHGLIYSKYKDASVWWSLYVATPQATFEAQFMKKLTNTEAKLKKKRDL